MSNQSSEFAALVCTPRMWLQLAQRLRSTADVLAPKIENLFQGFDNTDALPSSAAEAMLTEVVSYLSVFMMLMAFAFENIMKAHLIEIKREELFNHTETKGELPRMLKTHKLLDLAKNCSLQLEDYEITILRRLTKHAEWEGRYPVAVSAKHFFRTVGSDGVPQTGHGWSSSDVDQVTQLLDKISSELTNIYLKG